MEDRIVTDKIIVGVDVSKAWLDLAIDGHVERLDNAVAAVGAALDRLGAHRIGLIAFEPTGGYERALVAAARARGIALRRVHPNALCAFRTVHRIGAKTDAIDARLIAAYAAAVPSGPAYQPSPDPHLDALVARRRQLVDMRHAERCRREGAEGAVAASHDTVIACLTAQIEAVEACIQRGLAEDGPHRELARTLLAVKGVGPITAATLIATLPELGRRSAKTIAALVGLAPRTRQSGTLTGRATIGHGRRSVRLVLFNATRAAIRSNPPIRAFFQGLVARAKPGRVAFTAAMRKLLVIRNAKTRDALANTP